MNARQAALSALQPLARRAPDPRQALRDDLHAPRGLVLEAAGVFVDASRQAIDREGLAALHALARAAGVEAARDRLLAGEAVNLTEGRAATHVWLRDGTERAPAAERAAIARELDRMLALAEDVREGRRVTADGQRFEAVLHIGIGGSALGPEMLCRALAGHATRALRLRFVSNVDPAAFDDATADLDPRRTLVVVVSKSWTTQETALNARAARRWLADGGVPREHQGVQLVGVTARPALAREDGLPDDAILPFAETVGGRYSSWSAVGFSVALAIGAAGFRALLAGAAAMDRHFAQAPLESNLPVLLGLLDAWNLARGAQTLAVLPYASRLARLPAYLQQLVMESDGKRVTCDGEPLAVPASPVIWGEPGTDAQHSFFQMLHQGMQAHPVEFVAVRPDPAAVPDPLDRDRLLLAHCLAQSAALLHGRPPEAIRAALADQGVNSTQAGRLVPHQVHPGGRPHTLMLLDALDPQGLGALLACWEHRTFVLATVNGINPYDQFGVELGKRIARDMDEALAGGAPPADMATLVARLRRPAG